MHRYIAADQQKVAVPATLRHPERHFRKASVVNFSLFRLLHGAAIDRLIT